MADQIQTRRDTSVNWTSVNPVLALAEAGYETDTGQIKYGNGSSSWSSLPYFAPASVGSGFLPTIGGSVTGPIIGLYSAAASTAVIQSTQLRTDLFPRGSQRANAQSNVGSPYAPANWGTHVSGDVGSGSDFAYSIEPSTDVSRVFQIQFPKVYLNNGTAYLHLALYPWTGSTLNSTLQVTADVGVIPANTAGTFEVNSVFYGSGLIAYSGTTGAGTTNGTLTGCTIASGTLSESFADSNPRIGLMMQDSFGIPILWAQDQFGIYVNDQITFSYGGIGNTSTEFDIITGYLNYASRTGGSALFFGSDHLVYTNRIQDIFGNNEFLITADGHVFTFDANGVYPNTALNLGLPAVPWGTATVTVVQVANGSKSAPGHSFTNDPASGLYSIASGQWGLSAASVTAASVSSTGVALLRIPTAPTAAASVNNTQIATTAYVNAATSSASVGGNMNTSLYDPAAVRQQLVGTTATQTISGKRITARVSSLSANAASVSINTDTFDGVEITGQSASVTFSTTGTPQLQDWLEIGITGTTSVPFAFSSNFESSGTVTLPSGTSGTTRLDMAFKWNPTTSKWRIQGFS